MADPNHDKDAQAAEKRGQDKGREDNAAQPPRTMDQDVDPASYPSAKRDDAVELVVGEGRVGREAGPAGGKRD